MGKGCKFNPAWMSKPEYSKWLKAVQGDSEKALCVPCNRSIFLGSMGESALRSHMKGSKHAAAIDMGSKNDSIMAFMKPKSVTTESVSKEKVVPSIVPSPQTTTQPMLGMDAHVTKSDLLQAEVLWTLKTVSSHQSYRSSDDTDKLFARMFPDSAIAAKFSCAAKKTSYMTVFGIAEHIKDQLVLTIKDSGPYVLLFDESLNKKSQAKQMDIHARFWDESCQVKTRYLESVFMGEFRLSIMQKLDLIYISNNKLIHGFIFFSKKNDAN